MMTSYTITMFGVNVNDVTFGINLMTLHFGVTIIQNAKIGAKTNYISKDTYINNL